MDGLLDVLGGLWAVLGGLWARKMEPKYSPNQVQQRSNIETFFFTTFRLIVDAKIDEHGCLFRMKSGLQTTANRFLAEQCDYEKTMYLWWF